MTGIRTTLCVLVAFSVLTGCVSTSQGEPVAATPNPAPHRGDVPGVPTVDAPLDATPFLDRPCDVLDRIQLAGFGVVDAGRSSTDGAVAEGIGPQCIWNAKPEVASSFDVGFIIGADGLYTLYAARDQQEYFEETTVLGYPAVFTSAVDLRDSGHCNINVGINDSLTFRSAESGQLDARNACARAKQVAAAVVTTLKEIA